MRATEGGGWRRRSGCFAGEAARASGRQWPGRGGGGCEAACVRRRVWRGGAGGAFAGAGTALGCVELLGRVVPGEGGAEGSGLDHGPALVKAQSGRGSNGFQTSQDDSAIGFLRDTECLPRTSGSKDDPSFRIDYPHDHGGNVPLQAPAVNLGTRCAAGGPALLQAVVGLGRALPCMAFKPVRPRASTVVRGWSNVVRRPCHESCKSTRHDQ